MKIICLCLFLSIVATSYGQSSQDVLDAPFRLNVRVIYPGEKAQPEHAAFIYKSLRTIPGVVLVERKPDAILMVNEMSTGKEYACTFIILTPTTPEVNPKPVYYWGDTWMFMNESPMAALSSAIKLFDVRFVEKERRASEDFKQEIKAHPFNPGPYISSPAPKN